MQAITVGVSLSFFLTTILDHEHITSSGFLFKIPQQAVVISGVSLFSSISVNVTRSVLDFASNFRLLSVMNLLKFSLNSFSLSFHNNLVASE